MGPELLWPGLGLLSVLVLVLANAYFVATEFSLVAVRRSQVELWRRAGRRGAEAAHRAIERLDDSIAATQLGITLASIGLGFLGEPALARLIAPGLASLGFEGALPAHSVAVVLAFSLVTFLHVVVGELAPKAVALDHPGPVALALAPPLLIFSRVCSPVLRVMNGAGNALARTLGARSAAEAGQVHSAEELQLLVSEASEAGTLRPATGRILGNVFAISRIRVREVMVPRERVRAVSRRIDPDRLLDLLREEGYTRLPVYEDSLDRIVGTLHTKDLFHLYAKHRVVILEDALRPFIEMRPDASISTALATFRRRHMHLAIVREEGGPLLGLVTLEDVLEVIVGEIEDEHDLPAVTPGAAPGSER